MKENIYIIIPAFNEERLIGSVIDDIRGEGFDNLIVIDDGSFDNTFKIAEEKKCITLKHMINRGKGAATQTGFDAAKLLGADIVVTIDADGQHSAKDIKRLIEPLSKKETSIVLGSRFLKQDTPSDIPISRRIANYMANIITYIFYGIYVTDSQSGFRAYDRLALKNINTIMDRYEFESEVLLQIKTHGLNYKEIPIKVNYTEYSMTKYQGLRDFPGQNYFNGIKMFLKMAVRSILS